MMDYSVPDTFDDVALVESVIFALKTLNKMMEEESDETLRLTQYLGKDQVGDTAKALRMAMVSATYRNIGFRTAELTLDQLYNARYKAGCHLRYRHLQVMSSRCNG